MSRLSNAFPLVCVTLLFTFVGGAIGLYLGSAMIGAVFGVLLGLLIFISRLNSSKAIEHSPEGEDAGYLRGPRL